MSNCKKFRQSNNQLANYLIANYFDGSTKLFFQI